MATIPPGLGEVLVSTPDTLGGAARFAGTRVSLEQFLEHLAEGSSVDAVPTVGLQQADRVVRWMSREALATLSQAA